MGSHWGFMGFDTSGLVGKVEGVYTYHWGNIFRFAPSVLDPMIMIIWFGFNLWACWLLFRGAKRAKSSLERRHYMYIASGVLVINLAAVKVGRSYGNKPTLSSTHGDVPGGCL